MPRARASSDGRARRVLDDQRFGVLSSTYLQHCAGFAAVKVGGVDWALAREPNLSYWCRFVERKIDRADRYPLDTICYFFTDRESWVETTSLLFPGYRRQLVAHKALLLARRLAAKAGVSIGRLAEAPSWEYTFALLEKAGLRPRTVFDIGVARGTPWLYTAFPDATFHLIDPTRESLKFMERIAKQYTAHVHNVALGDQETTLEITVRADDIAGSTFFEEVGEAKVAAKYSVPVRPFGQTVGKFERPSLAKIDVQGAEMLVLRGMTEQLSDIDAIIIEVSTISTVHGGPEMEEIVAFFAKYDWCVADIVSLSRRPLDGALAQVDILFVPKNSPLRADKRWAASDH